MACNESLQRAKSAKNDEFYTQLPDIEKELKHYRRHFAGKTVYCNCDDPSRSAFWEYFHVNFTGLGLKRLVSTHYTEGRASYKTEYAGGDDKDAGAGIVTPLSGDGDFRSAECLAVMDACDIIVTNPPFSLFREFVQALTGCGKQFLILGNMNAVTYKEVFPLVRDGRIWYGASIHGGDREFCIPASCAAVSRSLRTDGQGNRYVRVNGVRWFTNLDHACRHERLALSRKYTPAEYPEYDNYRAVNVSRTADIPAGYGGVMGVPVSFLDRHCPEQFTILGATESEGRGFSGGLFKGGRTTQPLVGGKRVYKRLFIQRTGECGIRAL